MKYQDTKKGVRLSKSDNISIKSVGENLSQLIEKGDSTVWTTPNFINAYSMSKETQVSAKNLKSVLPKSYHELVRFSQSANEWTLSTPKRITADIITESILNTQNSNYLLEKLGKSPNLSVRVVHKSWEKTGFLLDKINLNRKGNEIPQALHLLIPKNLHPHTRVKYTPSIWRLHVEKNLTATRLSVLLDEISLRLAKKIGYAPKLKINIHPENWNISGILLAENKIKEKQKITPEEADSIIQSFINS